MTLRLTKKSRAERIRDEFSRVGAGMTTAAFASHCIMYGFWTADEIDKFTLAAAQDEVRLALKALDAKGLPFAGKTVEKDDSGAPTWQQRMLWSIDDYGINISEYQTQIGTMQNQVDLMKRECVERFGVLPFTSSAAD